MVEFDASFCPHCGTGMPSANSRDDVGAVLDLGWGRVVLDEIVGQGGMGVIRRGWLHYYPDGARPATTTHPVAVKLLNPLLRGRERARRLFLGEAEALARLSHPNVVHFFGLSQERGQLAIVMELVHGRPLSDHIAEHLAIAQSGSLPCFAMVPAWHVFSQLLGALAATHALSIVHRDVKPSNILVRTDGVVKLTDYGIARVPASEARMSGGMAPGTGAYMPPEQVRGSAVDARSDLYSAAIVLYEMLTGRSPFEAPGRSEMMVRAAQLEDTPPPLSSVVLQAPKVLDVILARALAKDRQHRFASATEFGEALRLALGLPDTPGWSAQRRLAERAAEISRMQPVEQLKASQSSEVQALRTGVMSAYRG